MHLSEKPFLENVSIQKRISCLAESISAKEIDLVVSVLSGAFIFTADLVRQLKKESVEIQFIKASSYKNATEASALSVSEISFSVKGKSVLLIDDILDTGNTLHFLKSKFEQEAQKVWTCVLLDKPSRRQVNIQADFVGFTIENSFVVGYGLDFAGKYRNLKDIHILEE